MKKNNDINIDLEKCRGRKYPTKVIGLDTLLRDGLVLPPHQIQSKNEQEANGIIVLVKGKPGTGKTTLGIQLLTGLTRSFRKLNSTQPSIIIDDQKSAVLSNSRYYSIEQEREELEDKLLDIEISRIIDDLKNDRIQYENEQEKKDKVQRAISKIAEFYQFPIYFRKKDNMNEWNEELFKDLHYLCFENTLKFDIFDKEEENKSKEEEANKPEENGGNKSQKMEGKNVFKKINEEGILKLHVDDIQKKEITDFLTQNFDLATDILQELRAKVASEPNLNSIIQDNVLPDNLKNDEDIKLKILKTLIYYERKNSNRNDGNEGIFEINIEGLQSILFSENLNIHKNVLENIKTRIDEYIHQRQRISTDEAKQIVGKSIEIEVNQTDKLCDKINEIVDKIQTSKIEEKFYAQFISKEEITTKIDSAYSISPAQRVLNIISDLEDQKGNLFPCLVLDGLNILTEQEKKMINLNHVIKVLKKKAFFSILVYDGIDEKSLYQEYLADMVIELRGEQKPHQIHYFLHDLQISKSRFQPAAYGWHQYKIRDFGLHVFKSIHFHIHKNNYVDKQLIKSFNPISISLSATGKEKNRLPLNIENILYAPTEGSFTVILGPRATFKTPLSLNFLYGKSKEQKEKEEGDSLLVSLVDNLGVIQNSCKCPFPEARHYFDLKKSEGEESDKQITPHKCDSCHKNFYIFHLRPGCITPDEFFYYLEQRIKEHWKKKTRRITRLAFWDLTQLDYRFPLFLNDPMFLPGLVEFGKKFKIAMLVMGAGNSLLTPAASAVADNVIFCWRDTLNINRTKDGKESDQQDDFIRQIQKIKSKPKEFLAVYVDRSEGHLGHEGKEFTCLPISSNSHKQSLNLDCPIYTKSDYLVFTEDGMKKGSTIKDIEKIEIDQLDENEVLNHKGFIKVENDEVFTIAPDMIKAITDLQGMGGVYKK